jgi:phosphoribosylformylglycinamidine synthase
MGNVKRVYVEKKSAYAVRAKELKEEVVRYLGITALQDVRVLIRYDVENLSDATYRQALGTVFSEPPVDEYFEETFAVDTDALVFSVEYLPGQFDQRADSAEQCVKLLNEKEDPVIRSATTYVFEGKFTDEEVAKLKEYCINPVIPARRTKRSRRLWYSSLKIRQMLQSLTVSKVCLRRIFVHCMNP